MSERPGFPTYDPSGAVDAALAKLEKFTEQNAQEVIPHVYHFPDSQEKIKPSFEGRAYKIKQEMKMFKSCIAAIFSTKARETNDQMRERVQSDLLEAICVLKNHYPYINKLNGSPLHQDLVKRFFATIRNFNELIDSPKKQKSLWRVLRSYLCNVSGLSITEELIVNKILLPSCQKNCLPDASLGKRFQKSAQTPETNKVSSLFLSSKVSPDSNYTLQDSELFWMKALSLLRKHGVHFETVEEEFELVKRTPIYTSLTPNNSDGSTCSSWILDMQQILTPFPGEKIIIKGKLMKSSQTASRSTPVQNSFTLTFILTQTGFPFCSQHTGWALSENLIPQCPHRLDLLPIIAPVLKKKIEISQQFSSGGIYIEKAKQLHQLKKAAFKAHCNELLNLHENLCLSLVRHLGDNEQHQSIVKAYFTALRQHTDPFDALCETHQAINEHFITTPFLALQNACADRSIPFAENEKMMLASQQILKQELQNQTEILQRDANIEKPILDFVLLMGPLLGQASSQIILQEFSEIRNFFPHSLDDLAQKLQVCAFQQALLFQKELAEDLADKESVYTSMKQQLLQDIDLFKQKVFPREIPEELSSYFETRYMFRKENLKKK